MSYVACSLVFFKDINQNFFEKKDGFVAFKKKKTFNNHCLTCSD